MTSRADSQDVAQASSSSSLASGGASWNVWVAFWLCDPLMASQKHGTLEGFGAGG